MRFKGWRLLGVLLLGVAAMVWLVTISQSGAHDDKPHAAKNDGEHMHAPVPADYATVKAPLSHLD